jgi:protein-tyrosine phosphatase
VTRELDWDGCVNVRDLGGIPLEQGGETRYGVLVRADNIRRLTDAGLASLAAHGVTRIVDLRLQEELDADPPSALDLEVIHISLSGDVDPDFHDHLAEYADPDAYWTWVYVWLLENRRERIVRALAAIADTDGVVLFHCMGGKDRTGIVAALALRAAGVSIEETARDYRLSARRLPPRSQEWLDSAPDETERAFRATLVGTPPEAMGRALEHVERELGGIEAYLLESGLSEQQLARLRDRLAAR